MIGRFITFEGPDGAGKTTQIKLLAQSLAALGHEVMMTREPGGTRISDLIRGILLNPEHTEMRDQSEILLYAAARAQHVHERILPALAAGKIVLCDRFIDASVAYQAYGLQLDPGKLLEINEFAASGLRPLRTYLLDISVETSMQRIRRRGDDLDRMEQKNIQFHHRVRQGFLQMAEKESDRILTLDADRAPEEIARDILTDCSDLLQADVSNK